jgi:hypothetical protein
MLLNPYSLPPGYQLVAEMDYIFDREHLFIVKSDKELIFIIKAPSILTLKEKNPDYDFYQTEFPLKAVPWIVDAIENRLWRSADEGGLPSGVYHVAGIIEGEDLKVRRSMSVSGPGIKGFSLLNYSRHSVHFESVKYQETQVTDELLKNGLLDILKNL